MEIYKLSSIVATPNYVSDIHEIVRVAKLHSVGLIPYDRKMKCCVNVMEVCELELDELVKYVEENPIDESAFVAIERAKYGVGEVTLCCKRFEGYKIVDDERKWLDNCPIVDVLYPNYRLIRDLEENKGVTIGDVIIWDNKAEENYIKVTGVDGKAYDKVVEIKSRGEENFIQLTETRCFVCEQDTKSDIEKYTGIVFERSIC